MSEVEERVRRVEQAVTEIQVVIEERLSSIAKDVSDIKNLQMAAADTAISHAKCSSRQVAMWESHDRVHEIIITDVSNLYTKTNRNTVGVAKLAVVGGVSGLGAYLLAKLVEGLF